MAVSVIVGGARCLCQCTFLHRPVISGSAGVRRAHAPAYKSKAAPLDPPRRLSHYPVKPPESKYYQDMARKIFMRGPGSGNKPDSGSSTTTVVTGGASGGSMMLLLLLVALVAFILMKGRSRGGSSSTNSSGESAEDRRKRKEAEAKAKAAADKQAEDSKNNGKNTDSSKAKKVASDPGVVHRPAKVDEEYDKKHAAQPDNPFYIHRPLPQDWTGDEPIEMKPVPKLPPEEIEKLKPAKPPSKDGRTVPDPNRVKKKKSVEWLNGANATELGKEAYVAVTCSSSDDEHSRVCLLGTDHLAGSKKSGI